MSERKRNYIWVTWYNMKQRCYSPKTKNYKHYGGKGVTVCDEWLEDYHNFEKWALEHGWERGLTIDRIDTNGNYCPENCRIVDYIVQSNNKTTNRIETFNGDTDTVANLCRKYNRNYGRVLLRLKYGYSIEESMSLEPLQKRNSHFLEYNGERKTIAEWSRELGFKKSIIGERLKRGWSVEKALTTPPLQEVNR